MINRAAMETLKVKRKKIVAANFRQLLQAELTERCRLNPSYSLRSFARSLNVEPSSLSQMINGKRPITAKMKLRLGAALGLNTEQIRRLPSEDLPEEREPKNLTLDTFAAIADWYHYAILELTHVDGFQPNVAWIAQRLGITRTETNIAVERLFNLQLLKKTSQGQWLDTSDNGELTHLTPRQTSDAARTYQCQLLELSKKTVQEVPLDRRNHTSATFCFDPEDLPQAAQRITEFRRAFAREFKPKKSKEVFQIQISFFPLTKLKG